MILLDTTNKWRLTFSILTVLVLNSCLSTGDKCRVDTDCTGLQVCRDGRCVDLYWDEGFRQPDGGEVGGGDIIVDREVLFEDGSVEDVLEFAEDDIQRDEVTDLGTGDSGCDESCCRAIGGVWNVQEGMCCIPDCAGKECGSDGCGGECGHGCQADEVCTNLGICVSRGTPCNTSCECASGELCDCSVNGNCETHICRSATEVFPPYPHPYCCKDPACRGAVCENADGSLGTCNCTPSCAGKECGSDGCGGTCPPGCGSGYTCIAGRCEVAAEECNGLDDDNDQAVDEDFECVLGMREMCITGEGESGERECLNDCTWSACVASSVDDPGNGNWLWMPPGTSDRVIGYRGGSINAYLPGCLNGQSAPNSGTGCAAKSSYTAILYGTNTYYTFSFGNSRILGLRYTSKADAGSSMKYFQIFSGDGGNAGPLKAWLSADPKAVWGAVPSCSFSTSSSYLYVKTGPNNCQIEPNKVYYLFLMTDVTDYNPSYQLKDSTSDFIIP